MDKSKITCETLKAIRKQVADANGIVYTPAKCDFEGVCTGTCPACESEREYIENQLSLKRKAGNIVKIAGLVTSLTALAPLATVAQEMNSPEPTETIRLLDEEYFFDFGSSLRPEYEERYDYLADLVSQMPGEVIIITGNTDSRGSATYNTKLSQKRAEYVRNLVLGKLEEKGYNKEDYIIIPVGLAFFNPNIPDAKDEVDHEQNRRVSLFLYKEHSLNGRAACIVNDKVKENFSILEEKLGTTKFNEFKKIWKAKVKNERKK